MSCFGKWRMTTSRYSSSTNRTLRQSTWLPSRIKTPRTGLLSLRTGPGFERQGHHYTDRIYNGCVAGSVASYGPAGELEVTYWLGRDYWGKGIATSALREFLKLVTVRPLHGRAAKDNLASLRVLAKCGFKVAGQDKGFANARGKEIEELVLKLESDENRQGLTTA